MGVSRLRGPFKDIWAYTREEGNILSRDCAGILTGKVFPYSVLATSKVRIP